MAATEQEVLYGGAAGGGKSYAMVADPVRYLGNPNARMLLVRRSTEELREVSAWLSTQSGRYISHVGLYKRVKLEQRRKTEAATQRYLAQRYKEALEKAERLEGRILGKKEYINSSTTET